MAKIPVVTIPSSDKTVKLYSDSLTVIPIVGELSKTIVLDEGVPPIPSPEFDEYLKKYHAQTKSKTPAV